VPRSRHDDFVPRALSRPSAALALRVPYLFERVGVALTLVDPDGWHAVHVMPNVVPFEMEHGLELERAKHNRRCTEEVARRKATVRGEHLGFTDLFVPVLDGRELRQMLIAGPFLREPSTAADLAHRWRAIAGRYARTSDPEFSHYAAETLATVMLDDAHLASLEKLMEAVAELVGGHGDPERLAAELEEHTSHVAEARSAARMWDAARAMVDASTARRWASPTQVDQLAELGLAHVPEHAIVGLLARRTEDADPVEELVLRNRFQRASVDLARELAVACAQVGDHGVAFLLGPQRRDVEVRARFDEIASRAATLARTFGFRLHVGTSSGARSGWLPASYQASLAAAEEALSRGLGLVRATGAEKRPATPLGELRRKLAEAGSRTPLDLMAGFERYIEGVGAYAGYKLETARLHLEVGFERLAETFILRGALDARTLSDLSQTREESAAASRSVAELFAAYRRAVADLEHALTRPPAARRESSLERSVQFIRDHLGDALCLCDVARAGGLAPGYFSRLFKQRERVTFERYVQRLRVEHAKQLLARTTLNVEAVGRLCGFPSGPYFHRVFRKVAGETPRAYRTASATTFRVRPKAKRGAAPDAR
jgi:AraC-like DNA-binding protein